MAPNSMSEAGTSGCVVKAKKKEGTQDKLSSQRILLKVTKSFTFCESLSALHHRDASTCVNHLDESQQLLV